MSKRATDLMLKAHEEGVFSAGQLLVQSEGTSAFKLACGKTCWGPEGRDTGPETIFDLASLTKPLAISSAMAMLVDQGKIDLDDPASRFLTGWKSSEKESITIRHLLQHRSGLPDWKPYYEHIVQAEDSRRALFKGIAEEALIHPPGETTLYSDLGFIALCELIEGLVGCRLDRFCTNQIYAPLGISDLFFLPIGESASSQIRNKRNIAATENCPRRGLLIGEVHDDNCHAAGGVCGHAGLFGTADAVTDLLEEWDSALKGEGSLFSREVAKRFIYPNGTPRSCSYALGWDRPTWKTSLGGRHLSPHSIGHLGFTGVSAWLDHERRISLVLLTNRVHPSRDSEGINRLRKILHDTVMEEMGATRPGPHSKPPSPEKTRSIHLVGIAGTGMGSLAGMLKQAGHEVSGSDQAIYPPMSTLLEEQQIPVSQPFSPGNLAKQPDLAVIGNVCTRDHIEVVEIKRQGIAHDSLPGVLERFFLMGKQALVITGTHGKTTTSSMAAWLLEEAGYDPGFMIGGLLQNFGANFKLGNGPYFVVEGDEYDSAYFDKYPKFLHYRPFGAVITSLEFDHADIFDSLEEIEEYFARFIELIPSNGCLAACWDYEPIRRLAPKAACTLLSYGSHPEAAWRVDILEESAAGCRFTVVHEEKKILTLDLPMSGRHNIDNALACTALFLQLGYPVDKLSRSFSSFKGIARRQQVRAIEAGVRIIDDFAHHPTAVRLTLEGLGRMYPEGRLLVAFDPRTNTSSRNIFQDEFATCFDAADRVVIGNPSRMDRIPPNMRLDVGKLARDIDRSGVRADHIADVDEMARQLASEAEAGDTLAILSNGSFGGLHEKLLTALKQL